MLSCWPFFPSSYSLYFPSSDFPGRLLLRLLFIGFFEIGEFLLAATATALQGANTFFDRPDPHQQQKGLLMSSRFIHTFETTEECAANCPRQCVMRIMEELEMMPRWVCDLSQTFSSSLSAKTSAIHPRNLDPLPSTDHDWLSGLVHNQLLLIIVPATFFLILSIAIFLRRCTSPSIAII